MEICCTGPGICCASAPDCWNDNWKRHARSALYIHMNASETVLPTVSNPWFRKINILKSLRSAISLALSSKSKAGPRSRGNLC